jgi:formate-dependent nitrite reductase membrane component NrfD
MKEAPDFTNPRVIEHQSYAVDDGRNINPDLGALSGEGAGQLTLSSKYDVALQSKSFPYMPSQQDWTSPTYYDVPVLKEPVWIWSIPAYFYVGGVAGVGATLGAAVQLVAPREMRSLVLKARWVATAGGAVSAALLIHDLGRPSRFLNMLRVFRITSPMSMGSWILSVFSTAAGAAVVLPFGPRIFRPLTDVFGVIAGIFGLGLSGYTGVLLSQSAVPVWQSAYRTTPVLFLASGTAAAASFFEFFDLNKKEAETVERFGLMGKLMELGATITMEADACRIKRVGRPLQEGLSGALWQTAKVLTISSAVISVLPGTSRPKRIVAGLLGSAASICLRFGVFYAGKASARDPRASFEQQRQTGAPAVDPGHENARQTIESPPVPITQ